MMAGNGSRAKFAAAIFAASLTGCVANTSPETAAPASVEVEPVTGIANDALMGVEGMHVGEGLWVYAILYRRDRIDQAQLAAAPQRICSSRNMSFILSRHEPMNDPDIPGVDRVMVRCR